MSEKEADLLLRTLRENPGSVESESAERLEQAAATKLTFAKSLLQDGKR